MGHIGYEASSRSGNAVCAFNGTGYTLSGLTMYIPETTLCDDLLPKSPSMDEMDNEGAQAVNKRQDEPEPETAPPYEAPIRSNSPIHSNSPRDSQYTIPRQRDIALQNLPRAAMLPSIPVPAPSDVRDHNSPICSNPWTRDTRTGDRMTLDIVLVVPTQRIDVANSLSQPSSSAVWATQPTHIRSPMVTSDGGDIFPSSVKPTAATWSYSVATNGGQSGEGRTWNGSETLGTGLSNGVGYLNLRTVVVVGIFTLLLWAFVFLQCI